MIIDFRVRPPFGGFLNDYLFTGIEEISSYFAPKYNTTVAPSALHKSLDELVEEMDKLGVVKACVPILRADNPASTNTDLVELNKLYPDHFIGIAGLDVQDVEQSLQEIDTYVINGICKGVLLEPSIYKTGNAMYADDERLDPIYKKLEENDILTAITFGGLGSPNSSYYMPAILDHVTLKYPKLRIVACHGGWPWVNQICALAVERENLYICPDIYQSGTPGNKGYVEAANYMLQDKIIYGTTYPLMSLESGINCYKNSGYLPEVLEKVMYHNAAKLLGLE